MKKVSLSIITLWCIYLMLSCTNNSVNTDNFKLLVPAHVKDSIFLNTENLFSKSKAELGRYLFYDRRLSINKTKACATCHAQEFSFTDGYTRSIGAFGDLTKHNSPTLINLVYKQYFNWIDSTLHFPEDQISKPMMGEHPVEMGIGGNEATILERLARDTFYAAAFKKNFPKEQNSITIKNIQSCITSFMKTILAFNAPYDKYLKGDSNALNAQQLRGKEIFFSHKTDCAKCHGGDNFATPVFIDSATGKKEFYYNIGLYNIDGKGSYPASDMGLIEKTNNPKDMGKFLVPTLRNLAFTAPYFHDGSVTTLKEVIDIYENGGRTITKGINKGDGKKSPLTHELITGFYLSPEEKKDIIAFLFSLTDSSVNTNPAYANPFKYDETKK